MNIPEIESELVHFIRTSIVENDVTLTAGTPFRELGIDSLSVIAMVLFIERKFGVRIPEEELIPDNLASVQALAACTFRILPAMKP